MPGRHTASGMASSPAQDNIKVAIPHVASPEEPPLRRIKLKLRRPAVLQDEPAPQNGRPKRKSNRPARYTDTFSEPEPSPKLKKSPVTAIAPEMPVTSSAVEPSSPPKLMEESDPFDKPRGYSADFLINFIEDDPDDETSPAEADSGDVKDESTLPTSLPPEAVPSSDVDMVEPELDTTKPVRICSPEEVIKLLQTACHALSTLGLPNLSALQDSSSPIGQKNKGMSSLLTAADSDEPMESRISLPLHAGTSDEGLSSLIGQVRQVLRVQMVDKDRASGKRKDPSRLSSSGSRVVKGKHQMKSQYETAAERHVLAALQDLVDSNAINTNCIISKERSSLMSALYRQLAIIINPPQPSPSVHQNVPHHQSMPTWSQLPHQDVHNSQQNPQKHVIQPQSSTRKEPHQFLFREPQSEPRGRTYRSPYDDSLPYANRPTPVHQPGFLPRDGQSMNFSFAPPIMVQTPTGTYFYPQPIPPAGFQTVPGHAMPMPPPGFQVAAPPGYRMAPPGQHRYSLPSPDVSSYPHPGAVVLNE